MAGVEFKNKGNEFFKKGQHDEAIAWYTKAVEAEPSNHVYYSTVPRQRRQRETIMGRSKMENCAFGVNQTGTKVISA